MQNQPAHAQPRLGRATLTVATLLVTALLLALLPASDAGAQTVDLRGELADRVHEAVAKVRRDAGLPPLERRADIEQPAVAWAAWVTPDMARGGPFQMNPDLGDQVCCAEERPGTDPDPGQFAFAQTLALQGSTTTSDGARAATDRLIASQIHAEDGRIRQAIEDEAYIHVGVAVAVAGDQLLLNVHLRRLDAAFGTPPSRWPRPVPLPVSAACPDEPAPDFRDVPRSSVHAGAIGCVAARGITEGVRGGGYAPAGTVTRGQMASFLVRLLDDRDVELPRADGRPFADARGSVHESNIARLNAAGIAQGGRDGNYRPNAPVSREQMATFLVRTYAFAGGSAERDLTHYDYFVDDWISDGDRQGPGGVHGANVQRAAEIGVATGREQPVVGFYGMTGDVKRDQMASFLSRLSGALARL